MELVHHRFVDVELMFLDKRLFDKSDELVEGQIHDFPRFSSIDIDKKKANLED